MKVLLVGMGGLYNRGCEAIVWGTREILRTVNPSISVVVAVGFEDQAEVDQRRLDGWGIPIYPMYTRGWPHERATRRIHRHLFPNRKVPRPRWGFPTQGWNLILEVGGDTFATPEIAWRMDGDRQLAKHTGAPVGLWGMNFDPSENGGLSRAQLAGGFQQYSLITVRDEPSRLYLSDLGVQDNVLRMADPAFAMQPVAWDLQDYLPQGTRGLIGLNLSPFAARRRNLSPSEMATFTTDLAERLIQAGFGVLLVPHVFPPGCPDSDNDLAILAPAFEALSLRHERAAAILPPTLSAPQVKYAIARCTVFGGARMHSTIAAWSSGVPVLSLSYSVKAQNLSTAIYGNDQFTLDIGLATSEQIADRFIMLADNAEGLRDVTVEGVAHMTEDTTRLIAELKRRWSANEETKKYEELVNESRP